MASMLDKLSTVALITACAVITVLGVVRLKSEFYPAPAPAPPPQGGYAVGETVDVVALTGQRPAANQHTLLMVLNSKCQYCDKSVPLYQDLSNLASRKSGALRLAVVGSEPQELLADYVKAKTFAVDSVMHSASGVKARGTPTLLLIGPDEKIKNVWLGYLTGDAEKEVRTVLSQLSGS